VADATFFYVPLGERFLEEDRFDRAGRFFAKNMQPALAKSARLARALSRANPQWERREACHLMATFRPSKYYWNKSPLVYGADSVLALGLGCRV